MSFPRTAVLCLLLVVACAHSHATTKGLNQIVTPDIQPLGVLSVSFQGQNSAIANPKEFQFEIGAAKWLDVAAFQGLSPGETIVGMEIGIVQKESFLLSAGTLGIEEGRREQPFLEAGWYRGKGFLIAGAQTQGDSLVGLFGAAYQITPRVLATSDYISGPGDFATIGVTVSLTPDLSFNPALYISNSSPHTAYGYGVLTWNIKAW
jgi:hypothetical protein